MGQIRRVGRGLVEAVGGHPWIFLGVALAVVVGSILGPPAVLSLARKPVDYFTFNPWLKRLPEYALSPDVPLSTKVDKLSRLALFWFSADSPFGGTDWGFAVDVADVGRILLMGGLFGAYFALLARRGQLEPGLPVGGRRGGVAGMFTSLVGLSTGPCSVMGCGAPVLPVVGLAFAGLESGTLALLAGLSRVVTLLVLTALVAGVGYLSWRVGGGAAAGSRVARPSPA